MSIAEFIGEVFTVLGSADPVYLTISILLYYFVSLLYAIRLYIILVRLDIRASLLDIFVANLFAVAVNNITTSFRIVGEAARAAYIYLKIGERAIGVVAGIIFDKIVEAAPLAAMALLMIPEAAGSKSLLAYLVVTIALTVAGIIVAIKYWDRVISYIVEYARKRGHDLEVSDSELRALEILASDKIVITATTLISLFTWIVIAIRLYFTALSVGWSSSLASFILVTIAYTVISILTITPGGVGIIEGSLTALFISLGAPPEKALAITLVERIVSYVIGTVTGLLAGIIGGGSVILKRIQRDKHGSGNRPDKV
ncbi:lysylphosphatidylglycerol synthase transmembrane domain-containing protein [Pyrofollis japonicus]|uniref:lysylphosphatidylglycerol synthase transmembrane domain-containing protein n=1 Tax=Pyrofollis japonicus TaxID=3060460 RepID=UPI00295A922C|nr:lysylphosphatidylglycerol synthase transmembrane domain-containing protein [Pyrofollis japonicus]